MAKITKAEVEKLAKLCRLKLTTKEVGQMQTELNSILDYVEILQKVDVKGLHPTSQVTGLMNVFRPDEIMDYRVEPRDLLKNAPAAKDNQFKVKRIL